MLIEIFLHNIMQESVSFLITAGRGRVKLIYVLDSR